MRHAGLPIAELDALELPPEHEDYLKTWLLERHADIEAEEVAASVCLQGAVAELALRGKLETDWVGICADQLESPDGAPLAYSDAFGRRLYKFESQWVQSTINAIHTRWWLECITDGVAPDHGRFKELLEQKWHVGWYLDHDVSPTIQRHRMKSEIMQSTLQALDVILRAGGPAVERAELEGSFASFAQTGYLSAEFFRLRALALLGAEKQFMPSDTGAAVDSCLLESGGACDFAIDSKTDIYMGSRKRTARDKAQVSPLSTCHALELVSVVEDGELRSRIIKSAQSYATTLSKTPLDIRPFQMRDVPIPFGEAITPIEVVCAASLIARFSE